MEFFITFGYAHVEPGTGFPMRDKYLRVTADSEAAAREQLFASVLGTQWSMIYPIDELEGLVARFHLVEWELPKRPKSCVEESYNMTDEYNG